MATNCVRSSVTKPRSSTASSGTSPIIKLPSAMHDSRRTVDDSGHLELDPTTSEIPHGRRCFPEPITKNPRSGNQPKRRSGIVRSPACPDSAARPITLKRTEPHERRQIQPASSTCVDLTRALGPAGDAGLIRGEKSATIASLKRTPASDDAAKVMKPYPGGPRRQPATQPANRSGSAQANTDATLQARIVPRRRIARAPGNRRSPLTGLHPASCPNL